MRKLIKAAKGMFDLATVATDTQLSKAFDLRGKTAEDRISGFKGIVTQVEERMNGSVAVAIQPRIEEGKSDLPNSILFDVVRINLVEGPSVELSPCKASTIELKSTVKDLIHGFEGTAVSRCYHIDGCITYRVEGKMQKTDLGEYVKAEDIEQDRLEVKTTKKPAVRETATGGAPTKSRF